MKKKKLRKRIQRLERRVSLIETTYKKKNPNELMNYIPFSTGGDFSLADSVLKARKEKP